jgi:methyl-accepting chemotaxis protein/hemerythrin
MSYRLLEWDSHFSVGFDVIDSQHKRLIEMINELYESFITGDARHKVSDIVNDMTEYANYHFLTEEQCFERYGYPNKEEHKALHGTFIEKVKEFRIGVESGKISVSYDIMTFLTHWLKEHILHEDKSYTEYLKQQEAVIEADI